ncbi:hypothetical protein DIZ27_27740 [Streptomyces sp. NWU339]|uniref:hypothetical protein n=1 Tax=Streptomyces sp. NWU339 TaxID=2185284 RepID=UPI000D674EBA|nr:hypothetical protein [Streptomyces sp. NWU339]PWI07455.1 hypothetical protein DIZ27_27740 [Streptomyces sp. NWU339]
MSGRADSDTPPETRVEPADAPQDADADEETGVAGAGGTAADRAAETAETAETAEDEDAGADEREAHRARWAAVCTGVVLALAGLAAALLRLTGSAPLLVAAAYACGAGGCALAAVLGSRGRTRRALWLLVAGLMVMALGDQFD